MLSSKRNEKIIYESQHRYNLFSGFSLAIQVSAILYFLSMIRLSVLEQRLPPKIDFIILLMLVITSVFEEILTKRMFVRKNPIPLLSKKEKLITWILLLLWVLCMILIFFIFSQIDWNSEIGNIFKNEFNKTMASLS